MKEIIKLISKRDSISLSLAHDRVKYTKQRILNNPSKAVEILQEELSLSSDYLHKLLK